MSEEVTENNNTPEKAKQLLLENISKMLDDPTCKFTFINKLDIHYEGINSYSKSRGTACVIEVGSSEVTDYVDLEDWSGII